MHAFAPSEARADVSSWLSAGGGYGFQHRDSTGSLDRATAMSFTVGVGSNPLSSVVVGGVLRSTTYFSLGTDLSLAVRAASGGFARGQWGLALDLGPMWRTWGSGDYGRLPIHGRLIAGGPWGLQLGVGADFANIITDDPGAKGFVALLEMDLLRLTVMRQGATDKWWENPAPAGGRMQASNATSTPRKMGFLPGLLW